MIVEQRNGKIADGEEEEKEVKYSTSRMKDKKYIPQPIDTSDVKLSKELEQLADLMSKNVHEVWAETRIMQGWKYGEQRNDELKTHPTRPRILVRQHVKDSISDILSSNDTAYKNVQLFGTFLNGFDESLFDDDLSICVNGIYSDADCSRIDANGDVRLFVPLAQQKSAYPIVSSIPLEHDTINLPCGPDDVVIVK